MTVLETSAGMPPLLASDALSPQPSVTLTLGNGSWQQGLPTALSRLGMLRRVLRFGLDVEVLEPAAESLTIVRRYRLMLAKRLIWGAWRRFPSLRHSKMPMLANVWLADRVASSWVLDGNIFHGWAAACLRSLKAAKQAGAATLIEHPMLHPRDWQQAVLTECGRFSVDPNNCSSLLPEQLITRMEREYSHCDKIVVPSRVARQSFESRGYAGKVELVLPGVDTRFFGPPALVKPASPFRVCYVGRVELAKGIPYLLLAWDKLSLRNAELVLIGECRHDMRLFLQKHAGSNVRLTGHESPHRVAEWYQNSSIFVFPSANEGLASVLLEAMASGLPVIATDRSGAQECVTHGSDGFIVPARNVDALADAILWCYQNRGELDAMGSLARSSVLRRFRLSHYEHAIISLYRSMLRPSASPAEAVE